MRLERTEFDEPEWCETLRSNVCIAYSSQRTNYPKMSNFLQNKLSNFL